jgi:predicted aspartyl protease
MRAINDAVIRNLLATILVAFPVSLAEAQNFPRMSRAPALNLQMISSGIQCVTRPLAEITVATLRNAPIVTLFANGSPVVLLLDTGANSTVLAPTVAERIGAKAPRIEFQRQIHGISGTMPTREVELRSFRLGSLALPWLRVDVAPINTPKIFAMPIDGILGADVLSTFDVDLDLPRHRIALYAKGSCPDGPPWTGRYTAIDTGRSSGEHLFFPVYLEGRRITAIIDTGAQLSFLSETEARALGVTEASLAHDRSITTHGATAEQLSSHIHRFSNLTIGDENIHNPELVVTGVTLNDADIVLGANFLSSRRLWLSYGSFRVFLTEPATGRRFGSALDTRATDHPN